MGLMGNPKWPAGRPASCWPADRPAGQPTGPPAGWLSSWPAGRSAGQLAGRPAGHLGFPINPIGSPCQPQPQLVMNTPTMHFICFESCFESALNNVVI